MIGENTSKPLVSIIVPTYKRPRMLERAIRSILDQTYQNVEILVVDDNNEGDPFRKETEKRMKNFAADSRVFYYKHQNNLGGSAARNTGIKNARGQYISFLDDDDEYKPDKIEKQIEIFIHTEKANLGLVYCGMNSLDLNNNFVEKIGIYLMDKNRLFKEQMKRGIIGTPMVMVPRKVFDEIGGFKYLKYGQDYEMVLRILAHNYSIECIKEELVNIYLHDEPKITGSNIDLDYFVYFWNIKREYLDRFSLYTQRKIRLEYKYSLYRCYCYRREYKQALGKLFQMWMQGVWDFKLLYAPYFLFFDSVILRIFKIGR